jgi:sulfur-oxidizing protein SoxY
MGFPTCRCRHQYTNDEPTRGAPWEDVRMKLQVGRSSRREFFATLGAGLTVALISVSDAKAAPEDIVAEIKKMFGDKKLLDGKIKLDLPTIAENGLVVPLSFEVESPMTDADHVKSVTFFAEGNPNPQIASFRFTSLSPKAAASIRIRLAQTQNVVAIAEMSNGDVYIAKKEVKVTIGGCGG